MVAKGLVKFYRISQTAPASAACAGASQLSQSRAVGQAAGGRKGPRRRIRRCGGPERSAGISAQNSVPSPACAPRAAAARERAIAACTSWSRSRRSWDEDLQDETRAKKRKKPAGQANHRRRRAGDEDGRRRHFVRRNVAIPVDTGGRAIVGVDVVKQDRPITCPSDARARSSKRTGQKVHETWPDGGYLINGRN